MKLIETALSGLKVIEPSIYLDSRGRFFEGYNRRDLAELGVTCEFVQDNYSYSNRNVLRGMHYQVKRPQGKLVRVVSGEVFDVAVDLRRSSPTFGKWIGIDISAENGRAVWIPAGFAHGYYVKSNEAISIYKTTDYYAPEYERCLAWDDPEIGIEWPLTRQPNLSAKDRAGTGLRDAEIFP